MQANDVLAFWYGNEWFSGLTEDPKYIRTRKAMWFGRNECVDECCKRFIETVRSEAKTWDVSPDTDVARVVLFDQIPRNAFRGKAEAFAYDHLALEATLRLIDVDIPTVAKKQLATCLMHSEDLNMHAVALRIGGNARCLREHTDVIRRFGRYPSRNDVLGRESTQDEKEWLRDPPAWALSQSV